VSTSRCTLACDMCPTHSRKVPKDYKYRQTAANDMSLELFKKTLERFPEALSVHIIGAGEPMLNRNFFRMVGHAKKKRGLEVKSFTNGTTIRENMDKILASPLDGLTVSINAHSREEFNRLTGMRPGIFDKIYKDTKELIERKKSKKSPLKVKLSFIIDKVNFKHLDSMVKLLGELKADYAFLCNFLPCPYDELTPQKRVITKNDKEIMKFIRDFRDNLPVHLKEKLSFPRVIDSAMKENKCSIHFDQVRVDGDGKVSSCSMMLLNMKEAGSIDEEDPWNSAHLVRMRKKFLENKDIEEPCFHCPSNKGIEIA